LPTRLHSHKSPYSTFMICCSKTLWIKSYYYKLYIVTLVHTFDNLGRWNILPSQIKLNSPKLIGHRRRLSKVWTRNIQSKASIKNYFEQNKICRLARHENGSKIQNWWRTTKMDPLFWWCYFNYFLYSIISLWSGSRSWVFINNSIVITVKKFRRDFAQLAIMKEFFVHTFFQNF
jgi:hypothetical protein